AYGMHGGQGWTTLPNGSMVPPRYGAVYEPGPKLFTQQEPQTAIIKITNHTDTALLLIAFRPGEDRGPFNRANPKWPTRHDVLQYLRESGPRSYIIKPQSSKKTEFATSFKEGRRSDSTSSSVSSRHTFILYNLARNTAYELRLERDASWFQRATISLRVAIDRIGFSPAYNIVTNSSHGWQSNDIPGSQPYIHYTVNYIIEDPIQNSEIEIDEEVQGSGGRWNEV
ncbi:MAG: hypothetical protein WCE21_02515, partial [Candidatus Babeliales bacterium]